MSTLDIEEKIAEMLRTVFDPEIPVNVLDLGLIYRIDVEEDGKVSIDMTLTAPTCPAGEYISQDIRDKVSSIKGVTGVEINIVFEPEWNQEMMSEEAKLELGML